MKREEITREHRTAEELTVTLGKRGHIVTSWDELPQVTMDETGIETTSYRIGLPNNDRAPLFSKYISLQIVGSRHTLTHVTTLRYS